MCIECGTSEERAEVTREQIEDWVTALRSGKYSQTKGALYGGDTNPSYCCLGVYGVLNGGTTGSNYIVLDGVKWGSYLPNALMVQNAQSFFSTLNDTHKLTFKQIAHIAKSMPLGSFQSDQWWKDNPWFQGAIELALRAVQGT